MFIERVYSNFNVKLIYIKCCVYCISFDALCLHRLISTQCYFFSEPHRKVSPSCSVLKIVSIYQLLNIFMLAFYLMREPDT